MKNDISYILQFFDCLAVHSNLDQRCQFLFFCQSTTRNIVNKDWYHFRAFSIFCSVSTPFAVFSRFPPHFPSSFTFLHSLFLQVVACDSIASRAFLLPFPIFFFFYIFAHLSLLCLPLSISSTFFYY